MEGIDPDIAYHQLNIYPSIRMKEQRRRHLNPERYEALNQDVRSCHTRGSLEKLNTTNGLLILSLKGKTMGNRECA